MNTNQKLIDRWRFAESADSLIDFDVPDDNPDNNDGGPGSGNHGHEGRPGKVGGSSSSGHVEAASVKSHLAEYQVKYLSSPNTEVIGGWGMISACRKYMQSEGASEETIHEVDRLFDGHKNGGDSQKNCDEAIFKHINDGDAIGKALISRSQFETGCYEEWKASHHDSNQLNEDGELRVYRKGDRKNGVECWTIDPDGADMGYGGIGVDHESTLEQLQREGFSVIAGFGTMGGAPGEGEITFVKTGKGEPGDADEHGKKRGTSITTGEKKAIQQYSGDSRSVTEAQAVEIENAIAKSEPLDDSYEYSRGINCSVKDAKELINQKVYEPGRLTSWSNDPGTAEYFSTNPYGEDNGCQVIITYRGSKMLDMGIDISEYSQVPDENEIVFSKGISMKLGDVVGDPEDGKVYLNYYDSADADNSDGSSETNNLTLAWENNEIKSRKIAEDGGPGSGNWGHEGRPGEVGGSAEGGGSHNRIGNKKEGYTSFSKNKKKFATPHKSYWEEYENCPTGSIVLDSYGKWKKNDHGNFINQDTGEKKWSFQMAVDNEGNDIRILAPDDSNPNFKKMKVRDDDRFSSKRKKAAFQTSDPQEADDIFREQSGRIWKEASDDARDALYNYTSSYYSDINDSLRSGSTPSEKIGKYIKDMTETIDKSELKQDTFLYRGIDGWGLSKMLGVDYEAMRNQNPGAYVGKEISDNAFMSCSSAEGNGFNSSGVYIKIYCPAGTKAMYAEPFSKYGNGAKRDWDGESRQKSFSSEFETILQRGTKMQITNMRRDEYGYYSVECQVTAQEYA